MNLKKFQQKQDGFTLTETMIVVAIIGILAAVAIPNFLAWLPGYRLKSAARDLQGAFQVAKLESVQRGGNVTITFTPGAGTAGTYVIADGGGAALRQTAMPSSVTLTAAAPLILTFNSRGFPNNTGLNPVGRVTMQNTQGTRGQIDINWVGRVTIGRSLNGGAYQQWD